MQAASDEAQAATALQAASRPLLLVISVIELSAAESKKSYTSFCSSKPTQESRFRSCHGRPGCQTRTADPQGAGHQGTSFQLQSSQTLTACFR
jgi:hypothetical protein